MKYKLIKKYPGSPEINNIATQDSYYKNLYIVDETNATEKWKVYNCESYPEFWEQVVEKDYQILSVLIMRSNKHQQRIVTIDDSEDYITSLINCEGNSIYSIKRLSDGQVFTIGDGIDGITFVNEKIKQITLDKYAIIILDCGFFHTTLKSAKKIKKPLFKTEDSVDIFEGDKYWKVVNETFQLFKMGAASKNESLRSKVFSTKKAAEEYIFMNKPCLSLKDVASIYISADKPITDTTSFSAQNRKIQELVKSKI